MVALSTITEVFLEMADPKSQASNEPPMHSQQSWQKRTIEKQDGTRNGTSGDDIELKHEYPTGLPLTLILTSVTLAYFLFFLDLAVLSTATPAITSQFDSLVDVGW